MITFKQQFTSWKELQDFVEQYLKEYPRAGYSTSFTIKTKFTIDGLMYFDVEAERLESCD